LFFLENTLKNRFADLKNKLPPDELKELVKVSLQQDGVLGKIKAQLRVKL
jgi:hypothetical protein